MSATAILSVAKLRTDGGTQSRAALSEEAVSDYTEAILAGADLPAPVAFFDGQIYWLADGFHRVSAATRADRKRIKVDVREGTQRDAILFSVGANAGHGLRRTNADKRRAVDLLLRDDEWSKKSDRWIAEKCAVSHTFVQSNRQQLATDASSNERTGQDGKTRKLPSSGRLTLPLTNPAADASPECGPTDEPEETNEEQVEVDEGEPALEPDDAVDAAAAAPCAPAEQEADEGAAVASETVEPSEPSDILAALDALRAQREADPDYASLRSTQRAIAAAMPARRGQRMIDFVLEGGELALFQLGLDWSVTEQSLRRTFRELCRTAHPDQGGSQSGFIALGKSHQLIKAMLGE